MIPLLKLVGQGVNGLDVLVLLAEAPIWTYWYCPVTISKARGLGKNTLLPQIQTSFLFSV